jgi:hypothetical protein
MFEEACIYMSDTEQRHRRPIRQVQRGILTNRFLAGDDLLDRSVALPRKRDFVMSRPSHRVETRYGLVCGGACNCFMPAIRYEGVGAQRGAAVDRVASGSHDRVQATHIDLVVGATGDAVVRAAKDSVVAAAEDCVMRAATDTVVRSALNRIIPAANDRVMCATNDRVVRTTPDGVMRRADDAVIPGTDDGILRATENCVTDGAINRVVGTTLNHLVRNKGRRHSSRRDQCWRMRGREGGEMSSTSCRHDFLLDRCLRHFCLLKRGCGLA